MGTIVLTVKAGIITSFCENVTTPRPSFSHEIVNGKTNGAIFNKLRDQPKRTSESESDPGRSGPVVAE